MQFKTRWRLLTILILSATHCLPRAFWKNSSFALSSVVLTPANFPLLHSSPPTKHMVFESNMFLSSSEYFGSCISDHCTLGLTSVLWGSPQGRWGRRRTMWCTAVRPKSCAVCDKKFYMEYFFPLAAQVQTVHIPHLNMHIFSAQGAYASLGQVFQEYKVL